jgi:hypothetical protein
MWSVLADDNKTVDYMLSPDTPIELVEETSKTKTVILMTVENSPAWLEGTYENGKFYPPKGEDYVKWQLTQ